MQARVVLQFRVASVQSVHPLKKTLKTKCFGCFQPFFSFLKRTGGDNWFLFWEEPGPHRGENSGRGDSLVWRRFHKSFLFSCLGCLWVARKNKQCFKCLRISVLFSAGCSAHPQRFWDTLRRKGTKMRGVLICFLRSPKSQTSETREFMSAAKIGQDFFPRFVHGHYLLGTVSVWWQLKAMELWNIKEEVFDKTFYKCFAFLKSFHDQKEWFLFWCQDPLWKFEIYFRQLPAAVICMIFLLCSRLPCIYSS